MAYPRIGGNVNGVVTTTTTVDCQKQVRSWRLLRSLMELLIPTCNCTFIEDNDGDDVVHNQYIKNKENYCNYEQYPSAISNSITFTGTIFGYRGGKVSFCIEPNSNSTSMNPILVLELAVPTSVLAKEMRGGTLRMVLETSSPSPNYAAGSCSSLLSTPLWSMYCNGRKVGYAVKRRPSNADLEALRLMRSVAVGAGVIDIDTRAHGYGEDHDQLQQQLMYLRAKFQRVKGSSNSESFHLIDPEGTIAQELSIFFCRSTSP
ncbi:hypothetical protein L6164_025186 [Bauhinia variegata]|uniref:Uncharacterized protein n=1 Tax=Bauhinia variegata TaxID=167791 RepID=A0ACB9LZW3_BAUVA|nr:hypothetical protein L6164_025186 [Bauhinia variegata]